MITEQDIHDFTKGACYLLADEISVVTGWPVCSFWTGFSQVEHVFNETPDGHYLDIEGKRSREEMISRWGWSKITRDHADVSKWSLPWWGKWKDEEHYRDRARQLIPELLVSA